MVDPYFIFWPNFHLFMNTTLCRFVAVCLQRCQVQCSCKITQFSFGFIEASYTHQPKLHSIGFAQLLSHVLLHVLSYVLLQQSIPFAEGVALLADGFSPVCESMWYFICQGWGQEKLHCIHAFAYNVCHTLHITYIRKVHHSCTLNCQYSFYRQDERMHSLMCCETPLFATLFAMAYYNLATLKTIDCANICRDKIINIFVTTDLLILTRNNWTAVNIPTKGKGLMISPGFENQDIEDDMRETALTLIDYQCLSNTNGPYRCSISTLGPHNGFCACEGIQTRSRDLWQSDRCQDTNVGLIL